MVAIVSPEPLGKEAVLGANRRIACWKYSRGQPRHRVKQRHVINLPDTETAKSYCNMKCWLMSQMGHVWTTPAVQGENRGSGAAMYPAFKCSRYGRWPLRLLRPQQRLEPFRLRNGG
jgi:hypothetical protein